MGHGPTVLGTGQNTSSYLMFDPGYLWFVGNLKNQNVSGRNEDHEVSREHRTQSIDEGTREIQPRKWKAWVRQLKGSNIIKWYIEENTGLELM